MPILPFMESALYLHLLGVIVLFCGVAVAGVAFETASRRGVPAEIALLLGLARIGVLLVAAGSTLVLIGGIWLAGIEKVDLGDTWLAASVVLFLAALGVGAVAGQRPKRARLLAEKYAKEGTAASGELRALLRDPVSRVANYSALILLLAVLALMVFRP